MFLTDSLEHENKRATDMGAALHDRSADTSGRPGGASLLGDALGAAALLVFLAATLHLAALV
jgi:hypothetical protein